MRLPKTPFVDLRRRSSPPPPPRLAVVAAAAAAAAAGRTRRTRRRAMPERRRMRRKRKKQERRERATRPYCRCPQRATMKTMRKKTRLRYDPRKRRRMKTIMMTMRMRDDAVVVVVVVRACRVRKREKVPATLCGARAERSCPADGRGATPLGRGTSKREIEGEIDRERLR